MGDEADEKGYKGYRLTRLERGARKRADFANWRKEIQASKMKLDDKAKGVFLNVLGKTGRRQQAADAAGVTLGTVNRHREDDPEFEEAYQRALGKWADTVHILALKLMNGVKKPIIGGKDKDQIIAHEVVHATNLLAMEMKRTNPEYKERAELDINSNGKHEVLVTPAGMTPEEWIAAEQAANAGKKEPGTEEEPK